MRPSIICRLMLVAALAGCVAACQTERTIPNLTCRGREELPPDKLPRIFRDPTNPYGYPYDVHETDGLSRNPDDCATVGLRRCRWGRALIACRLRSG